MVAIILVLFNLAILVETNGGECALEKFISFGINTELLLLELQESKGHDNVGAALIIWRYDSCAILSGNYELYERSEIALADECQRARAIKPNEPDYYKHVAQQAFLKAVDPSLFSLVWHEGKETVVYLNDGIQELTIKYSGYGKKVTSESLSCYNL